MMPTWLRDLGQLWKQRYWRALIIAVAIAAIAVLVMGGFRRAASKGPDIPTATVNQRVEVGTFALTPLCAWRDDLRPGQPEMLRGRAQLLILRARVENLDSDGQAKASYLEQDLVWLADAHSAGEKATHILRADDHSLDVRLQPRLPVVLDLVWELRPGQAVPTTPSWGIYRRRHVERGYLAGDEFWVQDGPGYRMPLPLSARCAAVAS